MAESKVLAQAAPQLGLKHAGSWMFGRYRDFPVGVFDSGPMQGNRLVLQVLLTPAAVSGAQAAAQDGERVKSLGLKPGSLQVDPRTRVVAYTHMPALRAAKPDDVATMLGSLTTIAGAGGPALGAACEECGGPARDVVLVNGTPTQMCADDFDKLRGSFSQYAAAAGAVKVDYGKAIAGGLLAMFLGAALWAGIGIATQRIFSLAAIGIALLVAFLLAKGAGKVTWPVIGLMIAFTLLTVFLGDILMIAAIIAQLGGPFDIVLALQLYPEALAEDSSFLLSYFFALIGVFIGGRWLMGARKAQAPRFEVVA